MSLELRIEDPPKDRGLLQPAVGRMNRPGA